MSKIMFGNFSVVLSVVSFVITGFEYLMLFVLPHSIFLSKYLLYIAMAPLICSLTGIVFYFIQFKRFTLKLFNFGLNVNILMLILNSYLIYSLSLVI